MDEETIRRLVRKRLGLRMEEEMTRYVLKSVKDLQSAGSTAFPIPVIAGDARTGVAVRTFIPPEMFFPAAQP